MLPLHWELVHVVASFPACTRPASQLCDGLIDGGVTPSIGKIGEGVGRNSVNVDMGQNLHSCSSHAVLVLSGVPAAEATVAAVTIPVNVLVRPRAGDFLYTAEEVECMTTTTVFELMICIACMVRSIVGWTRIASSLPLPTAVCRSRS
jgi:hypothetical protein